MKVRISREEADRFMTYENLRRYYPCRECNTNRSTCTGCAKEAAWNKQMSELHVKEDEYTGIVADCFRAFWDAYEANLAEIRAHDEAKKKQANYDRIREMIEVV